jgi:cyclohexadieny/prephenate dehydrogenase
MSFPFRHITLIGLGLIGSSLAHKIKQESSCAVCAFAPSEKTRARALELDLADKVCPTLADSVKEAELVILCSPPSAFSSIACEIAPHLMPGTIISDVGSFKTGAIEAIAPHLSDSVFFVPTHPIAGTEHSGIDAGFAALFEKRWAILTPLEDQPPAYEEAVGKVEKFWEAMGSMVAKMTAPHHDRVLALTSHLPHIIAWTMIAASQTLPNISTQEVIDYSGGGFKDFTRLASSDPVMWRDVLLGNQKPILEMIDKFSDELKTLRAAIEREDGAFLQELFTQTRTMRAFIIEAEKNFK